MKTKELDELNRDELFKVLKGKCKSRAQREVYGGPIALILVIGFIIYLTQRPDYTGNLMDVIVYSFFVLVNCCLIGWIIQYNYKFKKRIDDIETPDQLLDCYEKKRRNDRIVSYVGTSAFLPVWIYPLVKSDLRALSISYVIILFVMLLILAVLLRSAGMNLSNRRDVIHEKLQELVEQE